MRLSFLLLAASLSLALPSRLPAQATHLATVQPDTCKAGDTLTATGEAIGKDKVDELYLTDGKNDTKMSIVNQTSTAIKFRVPDAMKPGSYSLMLKTTGNQPLLLQQPVQVKVE